MKIGVLLPAYNEEKNIQAVIREAKKYLPKAKIVVVDDGSTDKTYELAKKEKVVVLRHEVNKGKGEAIKTGFKYFSKIPVDFVIIADTDRQYLLEDAPKLLEPLKNGEADFVMGYRDFKNVPFRHKLGNFVWRTFFNFLFGTNLKDTNCGYVALTKDVMKKVKVHGGYIIENAFLNECLKNNFRITQVPVKVVYREKSGILRGIRMVLGVLIFIIKEGIKYRFRAKK
jgi:glycosyltransferase involved in cell wall biosynthesis